MSKVISHIKLSDTLTLTECKDGYWLYDSTRGINLAMRSKTSTDAFVEALDYYQKRFTELQKKHDDLCRKVDAFLEQFQEDD